MIRGTIHDLVQWILELELENFRLKQELEKLKAQKEE